MEETYYACTINSPYCVSSVVHSTPGDALEDQQYNEYVRGFPSETYWFISDDPFWERK